MTTENTEPEPHDENLQMLADWCERGILEKPRVTDSGEVIKYRMSEKYQRQITHIVNHPELWDTPELQGYKELFVKLATVFRED